MKQRGQELQKPSFVSPGQAICMASVCATNAGLSSPAICNSFSVFTTVSRVQVAMREPWRAYDDLACSCWQWPQ
ncbi:hypothetical protein BGLT_03234 [Caballeronia glathei]|nr:hypothetical protein BGLT_03234 [Caballeronia glathei]